MSRGLSEDKQIKKIANTKHRGFVCLFLTIDNEEFFYSKEDNGKTWMDHCHFFQCSGDRRFPLNPVSV